MENKRRLIISKLREERGSVIIWVALLAVVFIGIAALAIDIGHVFVVRNELKNAADAGALAGARVLLMDNGTAINAGANEIGYNAAIKNRSEKIPVEVNWTGGNEGDVQRGHWSFATRTFTPNSSLAVSDLWGVTTADLDADPSFINAVGVKTRRQSSPAVSFFARIFGYQNFVVEAESVAYIGFAGSLEPHSVDEPIAICEGSILRNDAYSCNIGRFINNSGNVDTSQTGEWSNFTQGDQSSCTGSTSTNNNNVREIIQPSPGVCGTGNPYEVTFGDFMSTNNGELQNAFDKLIQCWQGASVDTNGDNTSDSPIDSNGDGRPDLPWKVTLPVIDCTTGGPTCRKMIGSVEMNILWITDAGDDPHYARIPLKMGDWTASSYPSLPLTDPERIAIWNDFVTHFDLQNVDGSPAPYNKKSIYFKPDCTPHIPKGVTGGNNYGIRAEIPVLVK